MQLGNRAKAEEWLARSAQLLPTAPAAFYLGQIEREKGNIPKALEYYKAAAGSDSPIGQQAAAEFVKIDLPQNPGNYVAAAAQIDAEGQLIVVVQNRSPVGMSDIQITPVLVDASGNVATRGNAIRIRGPLASGERTTAGTGIGLNQEQLPFVRFRIDGARAVQ
jgi:hypothetical protein